MSAGNVSWSWSVAADAVIGSWYVHVDCTTVSGIRAVAREVLHIEQSPGASYLG